MKKFIKKVTIALLMGTLLLQVETPLCISTLDGNNVSYDNAIAPLSFDDSDASYHADY